VRLSCMACCRRAKSKTSGRCVQTA
jgi:hypothetical protein